MARIQKDIIYSPPPVVKVFPKWKSADKVGLKHKYPNGILTLESNGMEKSYQIARYQSKDKSWNFRCSISDEENWEGLHLEFLIADNDKVYWKAIENNRLPADKLPVFPVDETMDNVWIGKHSKYGIGLVKLIDDIPTYVSGEDKFTDHNEIEVLCIKRE